MSNPYLNQIISSPNLVYILWVDAQTQGEGGWITGDDAEEFAKTPPPEMRTVGFLLHKTDEYVSVTDSIGDEETGNITTIPTVMIKNIIALSKKEDL